MIMVGREEKHETPTKKKINNTLGYLPAWVDWTDTPRGANGGHSFVTTDDDDFETFLDEKTKNIKFGHRLSVGL